MQTVPRRHKAWVGNYRQTPGWCGAACLGLAERQVTISTLPVMLTSSLITPLTTNQPSEFKPAAVSIRGRTGKRRCARCIVPPPCGLSPAAGCSSPLSTSNPANPQDEREVEKEANEEAQAKKKKVESTFQVSVALLVLASIDLAARTR